MATQKTLAVKLDGRSVGTLLRLVDETVVFAFDPEYEADSQRPILSLSFKGSLGALVLDRTRTGTRLLPFFSNLLPEGQLREYLVKKLAINSRREFSLLSALGQDLPGAVTIDSLGELSTGATTSTVMTRALHEPELKFSLAGVQLKFSASMAAQGRFTIPVNGTGGSWILKLPSQLHPQLAEIEYSMLKLAQESGIDVPEHKLVPLTQVRGLPLEISYSMENCLAVKRFDRTANGGRVHMEDFAQVYGIYPEKKYEKAGYAHIARTLWMEDGEKSYSEFVRRLVFSVAIGNGDMHLKNWSLLYTDPQKPALSPAYDLLPTFVYVKNENLALNLGGTKDFYAVTKERFLKMATGAKAPERLTTRIVKESVEVFMEAWHVNRSDLLLSKEVRKQIDSHLKKLPLFKI